MPSGERIQFGPNVNFLFETHDLSCASPATISRMGMIFLRYRCSIASSDLKQPIIQCYQHKSAQGCDFTLCVRSDEDTDVGALVKSWLKRENEENRMNLENWLNDYFHRALDWVLKQVLFPDKHFH